LLRTNRRIGIAISAALLGTAAAVVPAAPALAWAGPCSGQIGDDNVSYFYEGFCDGTGPATYHAWVTCQYGDGTGRMYTNQGPSRWNGDRSGSRAYCYPGHWVYNGGAVHD
jgi:hypothetical protein